MQKHFLLRASEVFSHLCIGNVDTTVIIVLYFLSSFSFSRLFLHHLVSRVNFLTSVQFLLFENVRLTATLTKLTDAKAKNIFTKHFFILGHL